MTDRNRHSGAELGGTVWTIGWLFTIGFAKLSFWKGVLAIVLWPYYLGRLFGAAAG